MKANTMKAKFLIQTALLSVGLFVVQPALAGTLETDAKVAYSTPQADPATYRELDALRTQNAILTEQLRNAELRSKMSAAKGSPPSAPSASAPPAVVQQSKQPVTVFVDRGARVQMVAGSAGQLSATIQMSEGGNVSVRIGARIPRLGLVISIKTNEVLVESGKEIWSVPFANEPLSNGQSATAVPPLPPNNGNMMVPPLSALPMGNN